MLGKATSGHMTLYAYIRRNREESPLSLLLRDSPYWKILYDTVIKVLSN
jgi:hypothetical protein